MASVPVRLLEQTTEGRGFLEPQYLLVCLIFIYLFLVSISLCSFGFPGTHYVNQANLELTEMFLSLPAEYWDQRHVPPLPANTL